MVRHIPCGTFVNESERLACERLRAKLQTAAGDWIILSNLNHAQHPSVRSDEIDAVVIGPPGVFVLEVKHSADDLYAPAASRFLADVVQEAPSGDAVEPANAAPLTLSPNTVPWLRQLLSSYPGSRHGNSETRGLDSPFAEATYVETRLDDTLLAEIQGCRWSTSCRKSGRSIIRSAVK